MFSGIAVTLQFCTTSFVSRLSKSKALGIVGRVSPIIRSDVNVLASVLISGGMFIPCFGRFSQKSKSS